MASIELVGSMGAFNELVCQLRSMHEEVCARNIVLEMKVHGTAAEGSSTHFLEDPWLPINFLPPSDSPSPQRLPKKGVTDAVMREVDSLRRTNQHLAVTPQEYICQEIDKMFTAHLSKLQERLASQEEYFCQQVSKQLEQGYKSIPVENEGSLCKPISFSSTITAKKSMGRLSCDRMRNGGAKRSAFSHRFRPSSTTPADWAKSRGIDRFRIRTGHTTENIHGAVKFGVKMTALDAREQVGCRNTLRRLLISPAFSIVSSLLVLSYAVLIAIETDMLSQDPELDEPTMKIMHIVYTFVFCAELLTRWVAHGWETWCGQDGLWNLLDSFLILSGLIELVLEHALGSTIEAGSVMRFVRIGRVIRTVRLVRTFSQFSDFQKMAYALMASFKTLVCSLAILIFVMFFFAVWLTQSAADLDARQRIQDLGLRYGSLMSTVFTLFLSVSNGISWDVCFNPLHELSWINGQVFILYIVIVTFGVLNCITSIFVDSVIRSVQHHKDMMVQDKEQQRASVMEHVRNVFQQVDRDGSGQVSCDEMEYFLQDVELRRYLEALDIKSDDTRLLFTLLDTDNSGMVSADEFCEGVLRMRGQARSIDVHSLTFRVSSFMQKWVEFTGFVQESFDQIRDSLCPKEKTQQQGTNITWT